jgi:hypothetical protein
LLEAKPRNQRERSDAPRLRRCEKRSTINKPLSINCSSCGQVLVTQVKRMEIEAELGRIDSGASRKSGRWNTSPSPNGPSDRKRACGWSPRQEITGLSGYGIAWKKMG